MKCLKAPGKSLQTGSLQRLAARPLPSSTRASKAHSCPTTLLFGQPRPGAHRLVRFPSADRRFAVAKRKSPRESPGTPAKRVARSAFAVPHGLGASRQTPKGSAARSIALRATGFAGVVRDSSENSAGTASTGWPAAKRVSGSGIWRARRSACPLHYPLEVIRSFSSLRGVLTHMGDSGGDCLFATANLRPAEAKRRSGWPPRRARIFPSAFPF